jgi:hypothetical protein
MISPPPKWSCSTADQQDLIDVVMEHTIEAVEVMSAQR